MRKIISFLWRQKGFLPVILVAAFVVTSLDSYQTPTVERPDVVIAAEQGDTAKKAGDDERASGETEEGSTQEDASEVESREIPVISTVKENQKYKDGTYEGTAQGFGGPITVQVIIGNGKIKSITIKNASLETPEYLEKAKVLLNTITKKQSTNVDAVSGATFSSSGIILATRNALSKAMSTGSTTVDDVTENSENTEDGAASEVKTSKKKEGRFPYPDGVYFGTGEGFEGDITVAVMIVDHSIRAIVVTECEDDEPYITKAKAILDEVVSRQKSSVDAVSGATYSSHGILKAIRNALAEAKKAGKKTENSDSQNDPPDTETPDTEAPDTETPPSSEEGAEGSFYENGTYTFTATVQDLYEEFWDYDIMVTTVIENDKITAISVDASSTDTVNQSFTKRAAEKLAEKITEKGTPEVDAISGATCSSKAIIEGCQKAMESAMIRRTGE
jgi:uncharacterized protein with FMN-binding domain